MDDDEALCGQIATALAQSQVISWHQGRMEFGPRALGSRSILGNARDSAMQEKINRKVKFHEGFRPFASVVLAEHAHEYFALEPGQESPHMLLTAPVREDKRSEPPPSRGPRSQRAPASEVFGHSRGYPCGRLGTGANRRSAMARTAALAAGSIPRTNRLPGAGQHQLQSRLGPDRLHATGRIQHLHVLRPQTCRRWAITCCARPSSR